MNNDNLFVCIRHHSQFYLSKHILAMYFYYYYLWYERCQRLSKMDFRSLHSNCNDYNTLIATVGLTNPFENPPRVMASLYSNEICKHKSH